MILCILFKSLLLPFPYRNKYMETNCESAAAVFIVNVPAKKVSLQGTQLTKEMIGLPLIRYSMVYTHTSWSLRRSPLLKCPPARRPYFPRNIYFLRHGSISGNLAPSYYTYKNLSIFHESVSIMTILDKYQHETI